RVSVARRPHLGQMDDVADALSCLAERPLIAHVRVDEPEAPADEAGDPLPTAVREVVEPDDVVATVEKQRHQVRAEEPRRAGDEDGAHARPPSAAPTVSVNERCQAMVLIKPSPSETRGS